MVTKTEQIPSRRTANQREVVRNKNQAAVDKQHNLDRNVSPTATTARPLQLLKKTQPKQHVCESTCQSQDPESLTLLAQIKILLTCVEILICIKYLLEPLLNSEGTDGPQALEGGRKVGEDRTPSCRKHTGQINLCRFIQTAIYIWIKVFNSEFSSHLWFDYYFIYKLNFPQGFWKAVHFHASYFYDDSSQDISNQLNILCFKEPLFLTFAVLYSVPPTV